MSFWVWSCEQHQLPLLRAVESAQVLERSTLPEPTRFAGPWQVDEMILCYYALLLQLVLWFEQFSEQIVAASALTAASIKRETNILILSFSLVLSLVWDRKSYAMSNPCTCLICFQLSPKGAAIWINCFIGVITIIALWPIGIMFQRVRVLLNCKKIIPKFALYQVRNLTFQFRISINCWCKITWTLDPKFKVFSPHKTCLTKAHCLILYCFSVKCCLWLQIILILC